jgi:hypothetical protein
MKVGIVALMIPKIQRGLEIDTLFYVVGFFMLKNGK